MDILICLFIGVITPIKELKVIDSNGEPVHQGEEFTITGRITCGTEFGGRGPAAIQDTSGAVSIYDDAVGNLKMGDSIVITGSVDFYNGLIELGDVTNVDKVGTEKFEVPTIITIAEMDDIIENIEINESRLVKLENVTIQETGTFEGNTAYTIKDASGEGILYIDKDTDIPGHDIPQGPVNIVGIIAQWDNDPSDGYFSGYELKPRRWLDFDMLPPHIETEQLPDQTQPGPYTVNVTITDDLNIILDTLYYDVGNGFEGTSHYEKQGDVYKFKIPTPSHSGEVKYYVVAYDENLNRSRDPDNEGEYYSFNVNVGIEEKASKNVMIFKNGILEIRLHKVAQLNITIYDIAGNKVKEIFSGLKEQGVHGFQIPIEQLCKGIYFVKISGDMNTVVKFVNTK